MKHFRTFIFATAAIFLSGCTSLRVHLPYARVETPDVANISKAYYFSSDVAPGKSISVATNAASRPPAFDPHYGTEQYMPALRFGIGLPGKTEVSIQYGLLNVPLIKAKWQILGSTMKEAKEKEFVLGVSAAFGHSKDTASGDQKDIFGAGGYPWKGDATIGISGASISAGYRLVSGFLIYTGLSYYRYRGTAKITQDRSATGDSEGGIYKQAYHGFSRSAALGLTLKMTSLITLNLYGLGSQLHIDGLQNAWDLSGGVELTVAFN